MRSGQGTYWKYDAGKYRVQYNGEWVADQRQVRACAIFSGMQFPPTASPPPPL
jgi:hypothetical protein